VKKTIYISLLVITGFLASAFSSKFKPAFGVKVIVIDAGHGGKDPGCHGAKYNEKDIALAVALKLGKYIEENLKDVKVVYTRSTDVFVELQGRAEIANRAKADLFISIHCNSACVRDKQHKKDICRDHVNGSETYVMGIKNEKGKLDIAKRENSAILLEDNYVKKYDGFDPNSDESYIIMSMFADTYLNQSLSFASKTQKQYGRDGTRADKGVKRASLWVLWRTYMPSVLTEIGYLSNIEEEMFLGSEKGQNYVASSIFRAFRDYKDDIEGTVKKYDDAFEKQESYKASKNDSLRKENATNAQKVEKPDSVVTKVVTTKKVEKVDTVATKAVTTKKAEPKEIKEEPKKQVVDDKKIVETKLDPVVERALQKLKNEPKKTNEPLKSSVVFKVQLLSSDKKIPLNSEKFKNVEKPGEYMDKGIYKYTAGECTNQEDAKKLQAQLRKNGFKDAFVIGMQDGKRITLK
jgi:N-acetylmuramoyl-L-alanine amidase